MKKRYTKPEITQVKLNPAQAVLTICSTAGKNSAAGLGGSFCKGTGAQSGRCKKEATSGDSASSC